jgi:hypothetical protein
MGVVHTKTVTVTPITDQYNWSVIDDATNSTATWITVTQQGQTDTWDFDVAVNTGSARSVTATVTHSNGVTSDSFTIDQAGGTSNSNPPSGSDYSVVTGDATTIFSSGFTMHGDPAFTGSGTPSTCPRGFMWGTDPNNLTNEIIDTTTQNNNNDPATFMGGLMAYSHDLIGLNASTTYYYKAFISTGSDICDPDYGSNPGTRIYGDTKTAATLSPQLSFTEFASYLGISSPTLGDTVDEDPFPSRITFRITASQDLADHTIDAVSLTKLAPNPGAGEVEDFSTSNSTLLSGSTINDLASFTFGAQGASNNQANLNLTMVEDNMTEGTESYRLTISPDYKDANGNVVGQHGLSTTIDFYINDTSIYQATEIGYGSSPYNALGSPTVTTQSGKTISTYTFDNSGATYGPGHTILLRTYDDIDPTIATSGTNTPNTAYWSNDANGDTNDHASINGTNSSADVHDTTVNNGNLTSGSGQTGFLSGNNANITFVDGQGFTGQYIPNQNLVSN